MKNIDIAFSSRALADVLSRLGLSSATPLKVAFSGGLDSSVLLHALRQLREPLGLSLHALHVDHGLYPDSAEWALRARQICQNLNISCTVERVQVARAHAHGPEAAARLARYAFLSRQLGYGEVLLTAHHADDQAETVLLQLLRGAGIHGLAAMPAIASFDGGRLARPLLDFTRDQLLAYAQDQKLQWIDDPSNADDQFSRNYVRHRIFPLLEARWPSAAHRMAHSAGLAAEAVELLDEMAAADENRCRGSRPERLSASAMRTLSPARRRNLVRYWLRRQRFKAPTAAQLEQIMAQVMRDPRERHARVRWPEAEVCRYRDDLLARKSFVLVDPDLQAAWNLPGTLDIPGIGSLGAEKKLGEGLSQERLAGARLIVRLRQGGEICRLPGRKHHHKLKKLLQEAGIPPWERQQLPLIYINGQLAAIGDRWVCEPYAARAGEPGWKLRFDNY